MANARSVSIASLACVVAAVALAAAIAFWARWGPDWPAQEFRAWTAAHYGLTAWTNFWYSGQALPGYSLVYPAISSVLGAELTGVLAVAVTSLAAMRLAPESRRLVPPYGLSVALVLASDLLIGQVPFLLGAAAGSWALVCLRANRPRLAFVLAVACSVASPLAGVFLVLVIPTFAVIVGLRAALPLLGALAGVGASVIVDGAGGPFPFALLVAVWSLLFCIATFALTRRDERAVRVFIATFFVVSLLAYVIPNPIGGNIARLGQFVALPLIWHLVPRLRVRNIAVIALLVCSSAVWTAWPAISSIARGAADPSSSRTYYTGLLRFLSTQDPRKGRLEVVFTREHWESLFVAQAFPIARGWERQTDLGVNNVLYHEALNAMSYHTWLDDNAVSLVALPDAPIDYAGQAEQRLLRNPPTYLEPVWHDGHWQVWRVLHAQPLASGAATMRSLGPASFVLHFAAAGEAVVRIRDSELWSITSGKACVSTQHSGWIKVETRKAGDVTLRAQLRWDVLGPQSSHRCS